MKEFPSSSKSRAPEPCAMKSGSPPTPLKARTGLFTPPGNSDLARAYSRAEASVFMMVERRGSSVERLLSRPPLDGQRSTPLFAVQLALRVGAVGGELHVPLVLVALG